MFELPSSRAKGDFVTSTQTNTSQTVLKSTDYVPPHAQVVSYVLRYSFFEDNEAVYEDDTMGQEGRTAGGRTCVPC